MHDAVVVKLGGSLLNLPDLPHLLDHRLARCKPRPLVLLAGGGALVDPIRRWHCEFSLSEPQSHALAMAALNVTADLLAAIVPHAELCDSPRAVTESLREERRPVVIPGAWFREQAGWFHGEPRLASGLLPESWEVTSDTLAACVAADLGAAELLLLKSVDFPPGVSVADAARAGLVDAALPRVAPLVPRVTWVNLRSGREGSLC